MIRCWHKKKVEFLKVGQLQVQFRVSYWKLESVSFNKFEFHSLIICLNHRGVLNFCFVCLYLNKNDGSKYRQVIIIQVFKFYPFKQKIILPAVQIVKKNLFLIFWNGIPQTWKSYIYKQNLLLLIASKYETTSDHTNPYKDTRRHQADLFQYKNLLSLTDPPFWWSHSFLYVHFLVSTDAWDNVLSPFLKFG